MISTLEGYEEIWNLLDKFETVFVPTVPSRENGREVFFPEKLSFMDDRVVRCFLFKEDAQRYLNSQNREDIKFREVTIRILRNTLLTFASKSDKIDNVDFFVSTIDIDNCVHNLELLWSKWDN